MMRFRQWALIGGGLLAGCATVPTGPEVLVLPGAGKTFEQFREEDAVCRHYAQDRVGTTPEQAAADSVARSAGTGALVGAAAGTTAHSVQWRYDIRYVQCMDAKGNQVPPPPGTSGHPLPPPPHAILPPAPP